MAARFWRKPTGCDGFTTVELLIAAVFLLVLTAALWPVIENALKLERNTETRYRLQLIREALEGYYRESLFLRRTGKKYRSALPPADHFWEYLSPYVKTSVSTISLDAWNRPFKVIVYAPVLPPPDVNFCPLNDYRDFMLNGNTDAFKRLPRVIVVSSGKNKRFDSDVSPLAINDPGWKPAGDDLGFLFLTVPVDLEGETETRETVHRIAMAVQNYFMQRFIRESENSTNITSVLDTNFFTELGTSSSTSTIQSVLGFAREELRDFWGNNFSWNCCIKSSSPYAAEISSPCGYKEIVQGTL